MEELKLNTIEEAIADFREGKFVIVVDDEDRENEGDLIVAAEKITPEQVNFMLTFGMGASTQALFARVGGIVGNATTVY